MLLGRVIGTIWATRKDEKLEGMKLLIVQEVDLERNPLEGFHVAVDTLQAGLGEYVLVARGSAARQSKETHGKPVDAVIMAIVENLEVLPDEVLQADYDERLERIDDMMAEVEEV